MNIRNNQAKHNSPLNLSLSQQENTQTLGAARFKPSAAQTERKIACEQGKTEMKDKTSTPKYLPLLITHIPAHTPKPGGSTWVFFGWVCAARDSKLAPRSRKNFP